MVWIEAVRGKPVKLFSLLTVLFIAATVLLYGYQPEGKVEPAPVYFSNTTEKIAALSFEVYWDDSQLDEVLQILERSRVEATFFLTGEWMDYHREGSREILKKGNEIGNHSMSHRSFLLLTEEEMRREIESFNQVCRELLDYTPSLFRPPLGEYNRVVVQTAASEGQVTVLWSLDARDYREKNPEAVRERVLERLHPGAVINFRVNSPFLPVALPFLIREIKNRGYKLVTVSRLIEQTKKQP